MREGTQPTICIVCKLPITSEQRPSIKLGSGRELHVECWNEYVRQQQKVN